MNNKVTTARINVSATSITLCWTDGVSGGTYGSIPTGDHNGEWIACFRAIAAERWPDAEVVVREVR
jgi:hypothetical protein